MIDFHRSSIAERWGYAMTRRRVDVNTKFVDCQKKLGWPQYREGGITLQPIPFPKGRAFPRRRETVKHFFHLVTRETFRLLAVKVNSESLSATGAQVNRQ